MRTKAPKINRIEMVRSDISGKLFPINECEVVIIKITKGKDEDINNYAPMYPVRNQIPVVKEEPLVIPKNTNPTLATEEGNRAIQKKHAVIPPAMRDLFNDPTKI